MRRPSLITQRTNTEPELMRLSSSTIWILLKNVNCAMFSNFLPYSRRNEDRLRKVSHSYYVILDITFVNLPLPPATPTEKPSRYSLLFSSPNRRGILKCLTNPYNDYTCTNTSKQTKMAKKLYVPDSSKWSVDFAFQLQKAGWRIQTTPKDANYSANGVTIQFNGSKPSMVKVDGCNQQFFLPHSDAMSVIVALPFWTVVFGKREDGWINAAYNGLLC